MFAELQRLISSPFSLFTTHVDEVLKLYSKDEEAEEFDGQVMSRAWDHDV